MPATLTLPLAPPEPDYTGWPSTLPWLPLDELASSWAAGHRREVACTVSGALREHAGRRATSIATMLGLRAWRAAAYAQVIAKVERRAERLEAVAA